MIVRFDDISVNTDMDNANALAELFRATFPGCQIIYAISPMVFDIKSDDPVERQRVFPKILGAMSDIKLFFKVDKIGMPEVPDYVIKSNHGILHCDHRLLSRGQQEISILAGCSLTRTKIFTPPFSKYNDDTINICYEHSIDLHRFSEGWLCAEHQPFNKNHTMWYIHPRLWNVEKLKKYLCA